MKYTVTLCSECEELYRTGFRMQEKNKSKKTKTRCDCCRLKSVENRAYIVESLRIREIGEEGLAL